MVRIKRYIFFVFLILCISKPSSTFSYERIVSLSPQITESIYLLGVEKALIANTTFCKRPADAQKKEKIGTPQRPDMEKIISLAPDIVMGAQEGNQLWFIERVKRLGINTFFFKRPKNFKDLAYNFLVLAKMMNRQDAARKIIDNVEQTLHKREKSKQFSVMWQVGSEPIVVATKASFVNDIIEYAGGSNIISADIPYSRINIEEVIKKNPQIIVLMDMGYNIETEIKRWKSYLKDPKFIILDPYVASSPTPVTFLEAVIKLREGYDRFF
ncbi:MAG: helical backbone metal receptor [Syntrophorhabdaceae bacterium]|nr:helical backbone metal receptor [Syntrophorhabdaceae bacterium]